MMGRLPRYSLMVGILTGAFGCDNVSWGGVELKLEPPPGDTVAQVVAGAEENAASPGGAAGVDFSIGPLLYAGVRQGDSALIVPVAELAQGGLRAIPQGDSGIAYARQVRRDRFTAGSEFTLFHEGARIGSLTLGDSTDLVDEYCPPRPRGKGLIELVPAAMDAERFLALEGSLGRTIGFTPFLALEDAYTQRAASLDLAGLALNEIGARWPPALLDIRQDLHVFHLPGSEGPALTATFLFRDRMEVAPVGEGAYSLLVLGEVLGGRYARTFTWYRPVEREGKGAPRYFSHLDWNRDTREEILLEVLGTGARWWAALSRVDDEWALSFQDRCEIPEPAGTEG